MSLQKCESGQTGQTYNRPQPCNQPRQNPPFPIDQKVKEIIMDTLIELNLVPKPPKKKVLSNV